jgi:transposase
MASKNSWNDSLACLPEVAEDLSDGIPHKARGRAQGIKYLEVQQQTAQEKRYRIMSPHLRQSARSMTSAALDPHVHRDNRYARYEAVRALQQQGFSLREISRRLKLSRETVRRFVRAESFPERSRPPKKASLLDPYKPYLLKRGPEGCWNGAQLYAEIKAGGYTGSAPLLRRFLTQLRKKRHAADNPAPLTHETAGEMAVVPAELPPPPPFARRLSPTRASWLCVSKPEKLDEQQRQQVEHIRKGHRDLDCAYQLSQSFVLMLSQRRGQDLDAWLIQAQHSGIAELKSFAQGLRRDYAAVRAAFTSRWSNGQVEAQVNCLKLQKRLMFGRANFDLLRLHVLRRA